MHRFAPVLFDAAARADARTDSVISPRPNRGITPRIGGLCAGLQSERRHHGAHGAPVRAALLALLVGLPTFAAPAFAQPARIANEYNGKNHQPTPAEVSKGDENSGLNPAPAGGTDARSVDQLNKQLLHDEAVDPPTNPASPVPVR